MAPSGESAVVLEVLATNRDRDGPSLTFMCLCRRYTQPRSQAGGHECLQAAASGGQTPILQGNAHGSNANPLGVAA